MTDRSMILRLGVAWVVERLLDLVFLSVVLLLVFWGEDANGARGLGAVLEQNLSIAGTFMTLSGFLISTGIVAFVEALRAPLRHVLANAVLLILHASLMLFRDGELATPALMIGGGTVAVALSGFAGAWIRGVSAANAAGSTPVKSIA
jgi:hypothetical protein